MGKCSFCDAYRPGCKDDIAKNIYIIYFTNIIIENALHPNIT